MSENIQITEAMENSWLFVSQDHCDSIVLCFVN